MISQKTNNILAANIFAAACFTLTVFLVDYYDAGDQMHYRAFWDLLPDLSFLEAYQKSIFMLGSAEPIYSFVSSACSFFMGKNLFIAILNYILGYLIATWLIKNRVSKYIFILLFANFYLLVVFFAAERLKLALILLLVGANVTRFGIVFYMLALLTHVSTIILLAAIYLKSKINVIKISFLHVNVKDLFYGLLSALLVILVVFFLSKHISNKLTGYGFGEKFSFIGILKIMVFVCMASIYSSRWKDPLICSVPILISGALLGPERIAMMAYILFMYHGLRYRKGVNIGVLLTSIYFAYKGYVFVDTFIQYGNGFYFESVR